MILVGNQHSDAQAESATYILSGDQLLLDENQLFRTSKNLKPTRWLIRSFLQHYDRGNRPYSKNI
jgi:hypothetical protein